MGQKPAKPPYKAADYTIRIMLRTLRDQSAKVLPPNSRARRRQERVWRQWPGCTRSFASPAPGRGIGAPYPPNSSSPVPLRFSSINIRRLSPASVIVRREHPAALGASLGVGPSSKASSPDKRASSLLKPFLLGKPSAWLIPVCYSFTPLPGRIPSEVFRAAGIRPSRPLAQSVSGQTSHTLRGTPASALWRLGRLVKFTFRGAPPLRRPSGACCLARWNDFVSTSEPYPLYNALRGI